VFPETITKIPAFGFFKFTHLTSLSIPKSVQAIGENAFIGTTNLDTIVVAEDNEYFKIEKCGLYSIDGTKLYGIDKNWSGTFEFPSTLTQIPMYLFYSKTTLTTISIPETVTSIGERAFYNCENLIQCNLPRDLMEIGAYAFYGTRSLQKIIYSAKNLTNLPTDGYLFYRVGSNTAEGAEFYIDSLVEQVPNYLFYTANANYPSCIGKITCAEDSICEQIGDYAFYYNRTLNIATLPDTI
jgi:hypothetical protein